MPNRQILLIGNPLQVKEYAALIEGEGVPVTIADGFNKALELAQTIHPTTVAIILPVYFEQATTFVDKLRSIPEFKHTPIVHIGNVIEGAELSLLHRHGAKTLTLGPLLPEEMARSILNAEDW